MHVTTVQYTIDSLKFEGCLVHSKGGEQRPGLVLAPNWLGVTNDAVRRAKEFAQLGYVVFVADAYGASVRPSNFDEAARAAEVIRSNPLLARRRMAEALDVLECEGARRNILVPRQRAAVGFCFGGGNVLELARSGAPIQAAVSIHGDLTTTLPAAAGDIKAAVFALHGAADAVVPKEHRGAFEVEMSGCGARWQMMLFGRALHAFTDVGADIPGIARYDAYASAQSYELAHRFMADAFAGGCAK